MKIAYIDDEISQRNTNIPVFMEVFTKFQIPIHRFDFFSSSEEFLQNYHEDDYDLIVLDIIMSQMNGVELAKKIREVNQEVRIVFCSTSNEYANESYEVGACYYIQKPLNKEDVEKMIRKIDVQHYEMRRVFTLPDGQRILLRNVIATEYTNHIVLIHMKKGPTVRTRMAQNVLIDLLRPYSYFIQVNSGNMINLYEVDNYDEYKFVMSDKSCYPIARRRKNEIQETYQQFLLDVLRNEM